MTNDQLAAAFADIADRSDIRGENPFAVRAYRAAAETIAALPRQLKHVHAESGLAGLMDIPGIGKEIAKKIESFVTTGRLEFYDKLKVAVPDGVAAMLAVPSLGPKRVKQIWDALGVDSLDALETAAREGKLRELPKMGAKAEANILAGIASLRKRATGRFLVGDVMPAAERILAELKRVPGVRRVEYAGSLRRGKETIGDLDVLVAADEPARVMDACRTLPDVAEVIGGGDTKTSVRLGNGLQVDVRALDGSRWGTAMQYFTGSQAHNIRLREIAQKRGWSLNEYALTPADGSQGELVFDSEAALYAKLGLPPIPPELREDRGEFDRPIPPDLVDVKAMRGDLQMHTTWSDGATDVMGMARAAMALGYDYICITDHTQSLAVANGLTPDRVFAQRKEIDEVNRRLKDEGAAFTVLHGVECEVKADGSLDLPDDVLAACDVVQASVHTSLTQPRDRITARAVAAIEHPHVDILGHPSGRLINEREGADYDWDALFRAAARRGTALEINANPRRLDLNETNARRAVELGCVLTISTDAHAPDMLGNMRFGVGIARRAWVRAAGVVNAWPLDKVLAWARREP